MADVRITSATPTTRPLELPELRPKGQGFGEVLGRALGDVNRLQTEAGEAAARLGAGQGQDMTETLLAVEKANISFQFAMQIRNKLLEAYQEIMRIQV